MMRARSNVVLIIGNPAAYNGGKKPRALGMNGNVEENAKRIIADIEDQRRIPRGSILSRLQTHMVAEGRYEAIAEVYLQHLRQGRRLTLRQLAAIFDRSFMTIDYALRKKGLIEK